MQTNAQDPILARVYEALAGLTSSGDVGQVTVGDRLLAVEVDSSEGSSMGVAHRPAGAGQSALPEDALELAHWAVAPPTGGWVERALGIAALNALSAPFIDWRSGDPMASLSTDVERIATVGLFRPALRKFGEVDVRVIERSPVDVVEAPPDVSVSVYGPDDAERAIAGVDVLFLTGSSLIYGGTSDYLRLAEDVPTVVLIGATASFLPEPAFEAGVDLVAGVAVTDPVAVREGIEAGHCTSDLHGLQKGYMAAASSLPGLALDTRSSASGPTSRRP